MREENFFYHKFGRWAFFVQWSAKLAEHGTKSCSTWTDARVCATFVAGCAGINIGRRSVQQFRTRRLIETAGGTSTEQLKEGRSTRPFLMFFLLGLSGTWTGSHLDGRRGESTGVQIGCRLVVRRFIGRRIDQSTTVFANQFATQGTNTSGSGSSPKTHRFQTTSAHSIRINSRTKSTTHAQPMQVCSDLPVHWDTPAEKILRRPKPAPKWTEFRWKPIQGCRQ